MNIDIGIPEDKRKIIAKGLSRLLADSYTLYLKTHNYHWNVTGPWFRTLHLMFEEQIYGTGSGGGQYCGKNPLPGRAGPRVLHPICRIVMREGGNGASLSGGDGEKSGCRP